MYLYINYMQYVFVCIYTYPVVSYVVQHLCQLVNTERRDLVSDMRKKGNQTGGTKG